MEIYTISLAVGTLRSFKTNYFRPFNSVIKSDLNLNLFISIIFVRIVSVERSGSVLMCERLRDLDSAVLPQAGPQCPAQGKQVSLETKLQLSA